MRLKPTFDNSFVIQYKRGKDVQTTEIVEATEEEVHVLINKTLKGKFRHPDSKDAKATRIAVMMIDTLHQKQTVSNFRYTKNGEDFERQFAWVYNMSPRQVRIEIEKAL